MAEGLIEISYAVINGLLGLEALEVRLLSVTPCPVTQRLKLLVEAPRIPESGTGAPVELCVHLQSNGAGFEPTPTLMVWTQSKG